MVSSDLGACEWFVWDLRRSGLIDRGQLDQVIGEFLRKNPRAEPPALAEYLISQNVLSPFQAERILGGKSQGLVLGPYVLMDVLGAGSMGQVFKAQSKTDGEWFAIKVLPRRSMWNVRLARRQVRAFTQFSHPSIVPFVDVGTSGGQHYLAWPLVEGETLETRIQRDGKLPPEQAAHLGLQIAQGLTLSHQNGVFHGLVKPSNIMLSPDGQAKILDFGIGSLLVDNDSQESLVDTMSTSNTLMSGLDCASPESIMEPTNRTPAGDQYSLGCVLYYCLAGHVPFPEGTAVEKMTAHQLKQPTPLRDLVPGLPEGLAAVVERLMQKSPANRFAGMDEVVEALQPFFQERPRPMASSMRSGLNQRPQLGSSLTARSSTTPATPAPGLTRPTPAGSGLQGRPTPAQPASGSHAVSGVSQRPAIPSRGSLNTGAAAAPATLPVPAPQAPTPEPAPSPATPQFSRTAQGWVPDEPKKRGFTPLLFLLIVAAIIALTYFLGQKYLFPDT